MAASYACVMRHRGRIGETGLMETSPVAPDPAAVDRPGRELDVSYADLRAAPADAAAVIALVARPGVDLRETVAEAVLDVEDGMAGDGWKARGGARQPGTPADVEAQLTLMSTRVLAAIEPDPARWPLAGDQVLLDLDLSEANLPVGTRLAIGDAEVVVTARPHTGCAKFAARFGHDALRWISTPEGRALRMRGMYVRVLRSGTVRTGDIVRKL
jgi:MOSC domain